MWKQLIESLTPDHEFGPPVAWSEIALAEEKLGITFPEDLRNLLLETNGVQGQYGLGLIWPIHRIVDDNLHFRTNESFKELYMPFDALFFFADAGNGDQFAFPILSKAVREDVFVWNHEDDSRMCVAPSLKTYLEGWLHGTIKV